MSAIKTAVLAVAVGALTASMIRSIDKISDTTVIYAEDYNYCEEYPEETEPVILLTAPEPETLRSEEEIIRDYVEGEGL